MYSGALFEKKLCMQDIVFFRSFYIKIVVVHALSSDTRKSMGTHVFEVQIFEIPRKSENIEVFFIKEIRYRC